MKEPAIVFCDSMSLYAALPSALQAARDSIKCIVVARDNVNVPSGFTSVLRVPSYSDTDITAAFERLSENYNIVGISYVVGQFTSDGLLSAKLSKVAQRLGLCFPSEKSLYWATNKFHCRKILWQKGVEKAPHYLLSRKSLPYLDSSKKWIAKPMIGGASSFIRKVSDPLRVGAVLDEFFLRKELLFQKELVVGASHKIQDTEGMIFTYNPDEELLVEEYLSGREYSVEIAVVKGRVLPLYVHDKIDVEERAYSVFENVLVAPPMRFTQSELDQIYSHSVAVIRALELDNTMIHLECRFTDEYGPRTLEVNARGAFGISKSFFELLGVQAGELAYQIALGKVDFSTLEIRSEQYRCINQKKHFSLQFFFSEKSGYVKNTRGVECVRQLPKVLSFDNFAISGLKVGGDFEETFLASLWAETSSLEEAIALHKKVKTLYKLEIQ